MAQTRHLKRQMLWIFNELAGSIASGWLFTTFGRLRPFKHQLKASATQRQGKMQLARGREWCLVSTVGQEQGIRWSVVYCSGYGEFDSLSPRLVPGWVIVFWRTHHLSISPKPPTPAQPYIFSGMGNEYQPKWGDDLWSVGSTGRYGLWLIPLVDVHVVGR